MTARLHKAWILALHVTACGGTPPPDDASSAEGKTLGASDRSAPPPDVQFKVDGEEEGSDESKSDTPAEEQPSTAESPETSSTSTEETAPPTPGRRPSEIITAPNVAYMFNYQSSAPKEAADKECSEKEPDDPQARSECLKKARDAFVADVLVFKKEGKGFVWVIYRRARADLFEVSKSPFAVGQEAGAKVVLNLKGGEQGKRPLFAGRKEVVLSVPSGSALEIEDPRFGHLVYEAKIGLVGD